jgi:hypothetical protein
MTEGTTYCGATPDGAATIDAWNRMAVSIRTPPTG